MKLSLTQLRLRIRAKLVIKTWRLILFREAAGERRAGCQLPGLYQWQTRHRPEHSEQCILSDNREKLMNTNQSIVITLLLYILEQNCLRASNSIKSSSSQKVSFINSSSVVQVDVGREAVLECLIQNLSNNNLVRTTSSIF